MNKSDTNTLGEINGDPNSTSFKTFADIFLALIDKVIEKLLTSISLNATFEGVEQIQHAWCDHSLLEGERGKRLRQLQEVGSVVFISKRATSETGKLTVMAILKDRTGDIVNIYSEAVLEANGQVLPIKGQIFGEATASKSINKWVSRETAGSLFTVGDTGLSDRFHTNNRVFASLVLNFNKLFMSCLIVCISTLAFFTFFYFSFTLPIIGLTCLPIIVGGEHFLKCKRAWERPNVFNWNGHLVEVDFWC